MHRLNDPKTQLELVRLKAAARDRKLARMAILGPLPPSRGIRARLAATLRSMADHVEPEKGGHAPVNTSWPAGDAGGC